MRITILFLRWRRFLWPLRPILGAALFATLNANRVERPANYVVTNARQILNATTADQHNRVLLQVVTDARNIGRDLDPVREANARHLAQSRVRLLRRLCVDACAHSPFLRA